MSTGNTLEQSVGKRTVTPEERMLPGVGSRRVYVTDDGDWYPSVTEITDARPNPQKQAALKGFRRKYDGTGGTEHHTDVRAVKLHFGTLASYHALQPLTDRDLWGETETTAERFLRNHGQFRGVDAWEWTRRRLPFVQRSFYRALNRDSITDVLGVERYALDADVGYAGQYDLCYVRQGEHGAETVLCELTTGKNVYPSHELHIAAYANAIDVDVDEVRIVRARPTDGEGNGDLEVRTEAGFDAPRDHRLEEFVGYTRQFHERVSRAEATPGEQDTDVTEDSDREARVSNAAAEKGSSEATDTDEDEDEDPIAQFVEDHTGAPVPMGRSLRAAVDDGTVPPMARRDLGAEFDDETLLKRLDELLPEFELADDGDSGSAVSASSDSDTSRPAAARRADGDEASIGRSTDTVGGSAVSESETPTAEIPPAVAALLDQAVASDDGFADDRATVVDNALESFLTSTVGTELNPAEFTVTDTRAVSIDANPVLERLLELTSATDERFEGTDDVARAALSAFLGLDARETAVRLEGVDRYRLIVDALLEGDNCPCETIDEVVAAALETYLLE